MKKLAKLKEEIYHFTNMDFSDKWRKIKETREFKEFYFFAVALILAFGTLQTTGTVMNTDKPVVTVISCSMYPHYDVGDVIVVQGKNYSEIQEEEIAIYESGTSHRSIPIIHRVIEKNPDYLETKGDNNEGQLEFEMRVEPDQIYGTAALKIPKIGLVKLATMDLLGLSGPQDGFLAFDNIPQCKKRT